ncbi:hypothetical protein [Amycolatopsis sp. FDAARGOS 1241]|uniref:hypothetical protein n=1 Tax=Amycolatopsis sp. FDAARGOS 1241 TaxID=2778070 RepID=UPI001EF377AC|nr:hypothetical protein [Amycolatopsis sp. FDAARGOS 1241]
MRRLGADEVVARGADVAERIREFAPGGADATVDAALLGAPLLDDVRPHWLPGAGPHLA